MLISDKTMKLIEASSTVTKMFEEGARLKAEYGPDKVFDFSLGNPEDEIVVPAPYFVGYSLYVLNAEGTLRSVPTKVDLNFD